MRGIQVHEGVKDFVGKYFLVILQMFADCLFNVNIESFDSVYMCSFLLVMLHLHDVVYGPKDEPYLDTSIQKLHTN